jgi:hypothetical protein
VTTTAAATDQVTPVVSLSPCPFCGSPGEEVSDPPPGYGWWTVMCTNNDCGVRTSEVGVFSAEEAYARWNRRATDVR